MRKFTLSLIVIVFMFNIFYPAIYATENIITEEKSENKIENDLNNNTAVNENVRDENEKTDKDLKQEENVTEIPETEKAEEQEKIEDTDNEEIIKPETLNDIDKEEILESQKNIKIISNKDDNLGVSVIGKMYIESPNNNVEFTIPDSNYVTIQGWAVSTDSQAILKLYLDDKFITDINTRTLREDVNKIVSPSYGGTKTTPNAGFATTLDLSTYSVGNHTIKIDQISKDGKVICSDTRTVKVKQKEYKGKMYLESPNTNSIYTLPNDEKVQIQGWAVSTDSQAILKLYLDDKFITDINTRTLREDVNKIVSPSYGGTKTTPNAGFATTLDLSTYSVGNHTIKIDQISKDGKVICSDTRTVKVKQKEYKGKMYLESPNTNSIYTLPNDEKVQIQGWAVSDDMAAYMLVYINGQQISSYSTTRTKRKDVDQAVSPSYGGPKATPNAGFTIDVDISNLLEGDYEITVLEVSRFHKIMCKSNIMIHVKYKEYKGKTYIETPTNNQGLLLPDSDFITVKGWSTSEDKNAILKVYLDGYHVKNTDKRIKREDVDSAVSVQYGGTTATPNAGFEVLLNISTWSEGKHKIKIEQVSRYGKVISSDIRTVQIKHREYKGKIYVENPSSNVSYFLPTNNNITVNGWAVSDDPAAYMLVYVDGITVPYTTTRIIREDVDTIVSPAYGGTKNTPKAGFSLNVDISNLHDGAHVMSIMEVSRYHKILCRTDIKINTSSPNYTGIMNVETPIRNKRYPSGWLKVQGWAITECSGDFMRIYLDGRYQTVAEATQRPDVLGVYGSKYPNHNQYAGFISNINTSGLAEGTHRIKIQHCSRYGKVIEEAEVPFTISNTTTWGIDVSHHNGTIDWNTVKNQGVNFAILKIGEYRESSGRIIVDEHFNEYYNECKRLGIAVGGYFYSYAFNPTEAAHEADACTSVIAGKSFEMPIFFDIEDHIVTDAVNAGRTNRDNLTNAAITFCDIMNSRGYKSGVYSYRNFFYSYLNIGVLEKYNVWLAHYFPSTDYSGRYDMWQYTSSGRLPGINGDVDLNWCFRRYY